MPNLIRVIGLCRRRWIAVRREEMHTYIIDYEGTRRVFSGIGAKNCYVELRRVSARLSHWQIFCSHLIVPIQPTLLFRKLVC